MSRPAAAIVTAVTKSGTNEFHGELFGQYTGKSLIDAGHLHQAPRPGRSPISSASNMARRSAARSSRTNCSSSAPMKAMTRIARFNVALGNRSAANLAALRRIRRQSFVSPFRGDFYFGKLTCMSDDVTRSTSAIRKRKESDIQGFGGTTASRPPRTRRTRSTRSSASGPSAATTSSTNSASTISSYNFNPTVARIPTSPSFEYQGVITFGGKDRPATSSRRATPSATI